MGGGVPGDMDPIFKMFFGGGFPGGIPGIPGGMSGMPPGMGRIPGMPHVQIFRNGQRLNINTLQKPSPIMKTITISLEQSYTGLTYPLQVERWIMINNEKRIEREKVYVKINKGIDTGNIIDQKKFKIKLNHTAYDNYLRLMNYSVILFKKNLHKILKSNYRERKQILSKGKYYKRSSVNYKKILKIEVKNQSIKLHNKIRSLIFPPYQMPIVNGIKVKKSIYKNNKIYLIESSNNKFKNS